MKVPDSTSSDKDAAIDLSIIVVNYNTGHLLDRMFSAVNSARGKLNIRVIVVDNASTDNSMEILRTKYPYAKIIENSLNIGFGRANNQALPFVEGRYVLLLNTDAFMSENTLSATVGFMDANYRCGVLGVKLVSEEGYLQPSCRYFPTPWNVFLTTTGLNRFFPSTRLVDDASWDHMEVRKCDWVPGCYYLIRRDLLETIGLFDPRFFLYCEELDHCKRTREAGWDVVFYPHTEVIHIGGESAKSQEAPIDVNGQISTLQIESQLLYFRKHYGLSGLLVSIFLTILADAASTSRKFFRRRSGIQIWNPILHSYLMIKILIKTKMATNPTH